MKMWKLGGIGLALLLACNAKGLAQAIPGVPPPPAGAAVAVGPAGAAVAAAPNIWSKLCLSEEQKLKCKEKLCRIKLVQLLNNSLAPVSALSGGIVGGCCPAISTADLRKPATSAEGAAARIKQDEAEAKARREAVRFLGTVDCRYWPEAQDALIKSLRADKNECVRWEAAISLGHGCCCTKPVIRALTIAVSCSNEDDNPIEKSPRVRAAARMALEHCVSCYVEVTRVEPQKAEVEGPEKKPAGTPENPGTPMSRSDLYYEKIKSVPKSRLIADAKRVLEKTTIPATESDLPPPGSRSMLEVMSHMVRPDTTTPMPNETVIAGPTVAQEPPVVVPAPTVRKPAERIVPQPLPSSVQAPPSKPVPAPSTPVKPVSMVPSPYGAPAVVPAVEKKPEAKPMPVMPAPKPVTTYQAPAPPKPVVPVSVAPVHHVPVQPAPQPVTAWQVPAPKVANTPAPSESRVGRPMAQWAQPGTVPFTNNTLPRVTTPQQRPVAPVAQTEAPAQPKQKIVFQRAAYEVPKNAYQYPPVKSEQE